MEMEMETGCQTLEMGTGKIIGTELSRFAPLLLVVDPTATLTSRIATCQCEYTHSLEF